MESIRTAGLAPAAVGPGWPAYTVDAARHSPTLNREVGGAFCKIWLDEANNGVFVVYEPIQ